MLLPRSILLLGEVRRRFLQNNHRRQGSQDLAPHLGLTFGLVGCLSERHTLPRGPPVLSTNNISTAMTSFDHSDSVHADHGVGDATAGGGENNNDGQQNNGENGENVSTNNSGSGAGDGNAAGTGTGTGTDAEGSGTKIDGTENGGAETETEETDAEAEETDADTDEVKAEEIEVKAEEIEVKTDTEEDETEDETEDEEQQLVEVTGHGGDDDDQLPTDPRALAALVRAMEKRLQLVADHDKAIKTMGVQIGNSSSIVTSILGLVRDLSEKVHETSRECTELEGARRELAQVRTEMECFSKVHGSVLEFYGETIQSLRGDVESLREDNESLRRQNAALVLSHAAALALIIAIQEDFMLGGHGG